MRENKRDRNGRFERKQSNHIEHTVNVARKIIGGTAAVLSVVVTIASLGKINLKK